MVLGLPRLILCLVSLARLPTETAGVYFLRHFLKEKRLYLSSPASRTCLMPRQDFFVPYLLPSHVKYYLNCQNRHFKTQREKLCSDDVNRASVL